MYVSIAEVFSFQSVLKLPTFHCVHPLLVAYQCSMFWLMQNAPQRQIYKYTCLSVFQHFSTYCMHAADNTSCNKDRSWPAKILRCINIHKRVPRNAKQSCHQTCIHISCVITQHKQPSPLHRANGKSAPTGGMSDEHPTAFSPVTVLCFVYTEA